MLDMCLHVGLQVTFLSSLPAMKGLHTQYLRALSHAFHTVNFEPREVVVRQGEVSDCMYVLKSGQVCILIDPSMTLEETNAAAGGGVEGRRTQQSSGGGGAPELPSGDEIDTKKLVQVSRSRLAHHMVKGQQRVLHVRHTRILWHN
jgi:hypothetical protein